MPDPEVTVKKSYRLTQKHYIHNRLRQAGTVLDLLPHEVDPTMEEVGTEEYLASELNGVVCIEASSDSAGYISLNGTGVIAGVVVLNVPRKLAFRAASDLSGVSLTVYGTSDPGAPIEDTVRGPSGAEEEDVVSAHEFKTVTGLSATGPVRRLTISALETRAEVSARVKVTTERQRALYLKSPRTPAEEAEIEGLMARQAALQAQSKRNSREEQELAQLKIVLEPEKPVAHHTTERPHSTSRSA